MAVELNLGTLETDAPALEAPGWDTPFRFAILGDFTGRANRGLTEGPDEIAERRGVKLDRENFDRVLADLNPQLSLDLKGGAVELSFSTIEDFHADHLVEKVERFEDCSTAKDRVALLSAILHHPDFKALEETWRGIDWFLRKAWTSENGVEILLYDLAQSELIASVNGPDDLSQSPLYSWLVEKAQKGYNAQPWGAIVGLYSFAVNADNAQVLGRIAKIARHASAPFLAGLGSAVWEKAFKPTKDDAAAWDALRAEPASAMLGLAAPGFLLRPPYGVGTKPVEKIAYEEYKTSKDGVNYVLGNAALFCGSLLAKSFTKKNWQFKPGSELELDQMAMHVARDDDNEEVLITVSAWLMQKAIDQMTKQGFMALRGIKGRNHIQLNRFVPLAVAPPDQPSADLIGSWGQKALKGVPRTPSKPGFGVKMETTSETGMSESAKSKRGKAAPAGSGASARSGGFDMDDDAQLMASADALEARLKAEREAAEGGSSDSSSDPMPDFGSDTPSEEPAPEMDPELAALMGDTPSEDPPSDAPSDEMDPELAALMASMDGDASSEPAAESTEEMDPELAALMKQMEEGS